MRLARVQHQAGRACNSSAAWRASSPRCAELGGTARAAAGELLPPAAQQSPPPSHRRRRRRGGASWARGAGTVPRVFRQPRAPAPAQRQQPWRTRPRPQQRRPAGERRPCVDRGGAARGDVCQEQQDGRTAGSSRAAGSSMPSHVPEAQKRRQDEEGEHCQHGGSVAGSVAQHAGGAVAAHQDVSSHHQASHHESCKHRAWPPMGSRCCWSGQRRQWAGPRRSDSPLQPAH